MAQHAIRGPLWAIVAMALVAGCTPDPSSPGDAAREPTSASRPSGDASPAAVPAPPSGDPVKAAPFVAQAKLAARAFDRSGTRRALDGALAADPACPEALELLGWYFLDVSPDQDAGAALLCFQQLTALGVTGGTVSGGEGVARMLAGDSVGARAPLEKALADPALVALPGRHAKVVTALARLEVEAGRPALAEPLFRKGLEVEPIELWKAETYAQLAEICIASGRAPEAEQLLHEALARNPEHLKSRYVWSRLLRKLGRNEEAEKQARIHELLRQIVDPVGARAIADIDHRVSARAGLVEADPGNEMFFGAYVRVLLEAKKYAEAEHAVAERTKGGKPTAEHAFLLARARAGRGDVDGADKARVAMRQIDPNVPPQMDRAIAEEYRRSGASDDAVERLLARWGRH